jgi:hypothetical protein
MSEQHDSEIVGRSTRISVSLDGSLHDFIQRTAGELHQTKSATIHSMIATMARTRSIQSGSEAA